MSENLKKLLSRKFLVAIAGIAGGVLVICEGNTIEGIITILISALGYLITEGYIDAKAVNQTSDLVTDISELINNLSNDLTVDEITDVIKQVVEATQDGLNKDGATDIVATTAKE